MVDSTECLDSVRTNFLTGGGELGALIRAHDWRSTPLGPPEGWPAPLRTAIRLILNSGHPMYIWWGPDLLCFYNDAYRRFIGAERHPDSLGQPARQVWDEIWDIIGPQIEHVMSGQGATWRENDLVPITRNGHREDVYWTYSYSPIDDQDSLSGVGGVLVICTETTQQVLANQDLEAEAERLRRMFDQAPGFMALLDGPDHVLQSNNSAYLQLIGHRDVVGKAVREALPELHGQGFFELLDQVYASGEAYVGRAAPVELQRSPGAAVERRFVDFVYQPITNSNGEVTSIFVEGYDVTERADAEAALRDSARHKSLLLAELQHRVRNVLTMVRSVARRTAENCEDVDDYVRHLDGRLSTLARVQTVLTREPGRGVNLHNMVLDEFKSQATLPAQHDVDGPEVELCAKEAEVLSLAIHELTTNSIKYGVLGRMSGAIQVRWVVEERDGLDWLHFTWTEPIDRNTKRSTRTGFGTELITQRVPYELHGSGEIRIGDDEVEARIDFPLASGQSESGNVAAQEDMQP